MAARHLLRICLKKHDCDRGALRDDREKMAARQREKKTIGLADGGIGPRLLIEKRFIAEKISAGNVGKRARFLIENLHRAMGDEIDPVGHLPWSEDLFVCIVIVMMQFFGNRQQRVQIQFGEEADFFKEKGSFN